MQVNLVGDGEHATGWWMSTKVSDCQWIPEPAESLFSKCMGKAILYIFLLFLSSLFAFYSIVSFILTTVVFLLFSKWLYRILFSYCILLNLIFCGVVSIWINIKQGVNFFFEILCVQTKQFNNKAKAIQRKKDCWDSRNMLWNEMVMHCVLLLPLLLLLLLLTSLEIFYIPWT